MAKRNRKPKDKLTIQQPSVPSAQTMFRFHLQDLEAFEQVAQKSRQPSSKAWERDKGSVERIEQAATAEELLDLLSLATG